LSADPSAQSGDATLAEVLHGNEPVVAVPGETCRVVASRLAVHELERLPVVADANSMRLVGIVARSDLIKPSLAHFEDEQKQERFRRVALSRDGRRFPPVGKAG
jgi:CBS-domain-containing membrane protein